MPRVLLAALFALCTALPAVAAEWSHLHLTASDTPAAAQWYADRFGGTVAKFGPYDVAQVGGTVVVFFKKDEFEGSEGSSVDHIGFSVDNTDETIAAFKEAGVKVTGEPRELPGGMKFAFVEDPWGTKIEIIDDPDTKGFHHIHLHSPDPEGTLAWYQKHFGGELEKFKGLLPAVKYPNFWLIAQKSEAKAPTKGRAIDHLGWSFPDMEAAAKELEANGVTFTVPVTKSPLVTYSFVEGPDGVSIELTQTR